MRTLDGRILVDLGDGYESQVTGSVEVLSTSSLNENLTTYRLLPERINAVPFISSSIFNTSSPQIKPIQFNDPDKYNMFIDQEGVVKVAVGSSFTLRLKAMQPPIYNVENGRPIEYSDQTLLTYQWQKDGEDFFGHQDPTRPNSFVSRSGEYLEELVFNNVSPLYAGTYTCVVLNDIGSVESEQVNIEVFNPDIEDKFYANLITNPYGKDEINDWNSPDMEFVTNRFTDIPFEKLSQPWKTDLFGYSVDMLYPRPYQLNTHHIRNSNFVQDLMQEGYYFTRERFKYRVKGGKALVNASYDVDVSELQDYIKSAIYGVTGVRAIFGCYIGNAISRYRTSLLTALITRRTSKFSLIPSRARLSIINALLSGIPMKNEEVRVTIQEFDDETPLMSTVYGQTVPGYTMYDPWTKALWRPTSQNISNYVPNAINVPNDSYETRILEVIEKNLLFPSQSFVPTFGQFAEYNRAIIDKLHFRTNKIRISIAFETWADVLNLTSKEHVDTSDECFELVPWDWVTKPMHYPTNPNEDYVKDTQSGENISIDWYNKKTFNVKEDDDAFSYATLLGTPRGMATGFNLVLIPLESGKSNKYGYYTDRILNRIYDDAYVSQGLPDYPKLKSGTSIGSSVGQYLATISDYDYEVINVKIDNKYNLPFNPGSEYKTAVGGVATKTTIATYKYDKANLFDFPPLSIYPDQVVTGIISPWERYNPSTNDDFRVSPSSQTITTDWNDYIKYVGFKNLSSGSWNTIDSSSFGLITTRNRIAFASTTPTYDVTLNVTSLGPSIPGTFTQGPNGILGIQFGNERSNSEMRPVILRPGTRNYTVTVKPNQYNSDSTPGGSRVRITYGRDPAGYGLGGSFSGSINSIQIRASNYVPDTEYIVVYNSGSNDLVDCNIEQVLGNLASGIAKYTNNLVTDVPISFVTKSFSKNQYLNRMGFNMALVGEDYGIPTTESFTDNTLRKAELFKDWSTLRVTGSYTHYYKLLQDVRQTAPEATYTPSPSYKQYIVYNSSMNANLPSGDIKLLLDTPFTGIFTASAELEQKGSYTGVASANPMYNYHYSNFWGRVAAENFYNRDKILRLNFNVNGQQVTMKYPTSVETGIQSVNTPMFSWWTGAPAWWTHNVDRYYYRINVAGVTRSKVKLNKITSLDDKTPTAIVIPSKRKVYYFVYSYTNNSGNEV